MSGQIRQRRQGGRFKKRGPDMPMEKKIESFILRNSSNGYFTKFSTITSKFNISESETWNMVGMLLSEGKMESIHDPVSGEMKICEVDKKYEILGMGKKRKFENQKEKQVDNTRGKYNNGKNENQKDHSFNKNRENTKYDKNGRDAHDGAESRNRTRRGSSGNLPPNQSGKRAENGSGRDRGRVSHTQPKSQDEGKSASD